MNYYIIFFILIMIACTQFSRLLPLAIPQKYHRAHWLRHLNPFFPMLILTLLIIYSVRDANWSYQDFGTLEFAYAEFGATIAVIMTHCYRRNVLLSIGLGTSVYIFIQYLVGRLL